MKRRSLLTALFVLGAFSPTFPQARIEPDLLAGMKARSIGPAGMSGRVVAIDAVESDPAIVYVGASTGGLWKSVNGGLTWKPIFDDQPVASIGAVAVFQPSPDIVWVGTGEGNPRNSISVGNGVYKSLDGGSTWAHLGLEETEHIQRIVLDPEDRDVAYVAALGRVWGENDQRGVFKTVDGGKTWKRILFVDRRTGGADLVMDPTNPDKLFAAMWDYRRWPWSFRSGGPGSGLFVTHDGGQNWTRLTPEDGLPEGDLGRIGVAIAPSDPRIVYALVEAEKNAVYVSRDGGESWTKAGDSRQAGNRPFYFAGLRVDPRWPDRVYSLWSLISVSDDGGKTFRVLVPFRAVHPDHHAMWINPADPEQIIVGNDGGVAFSRDRGETWRFAGNLPLAQYYHIRVDMDTPYHVYGGMQDNGSWRGPSSVWENGGIRNHHWEEVGFGDGFDTAPFPDDSLAGYSMSQEGFIRRWNLRTGERKDIRPSAPVGLELRFNWNSALALDPFDPDTLYFGSQFVHRSTDRGNTWQIISDDLTTNNPEWQKQDESGGLTPDVTGAENFTTIISIAPSPVRKGVIWVGTDDGRLHVTQDGGQTWTSVEKRLRGVPAHTWIPQITASSFAAGTAFVVLDDHRRSNWTPYLFRTTNYGHTWKNLTTPEIRGYCLTIAQDPVDEDLLFLGTEFGLWISLDAGQSWLPFHHGLPTVGVRDLLVHPRDQDLVIGTHGRAAFILDDIRPLRTLTSQILEEPIHRFAIPDAQQYRVKQTGASRFPGNGEFRGENRPYGALITFSLNEEDLPYPDKKKEKARKEARRRAKRRQGEPASTASQHRRAPSETGPEAAKQEKAGEQGPQVTISVQDADGTPIRTFKAPATLGINRAAWDLHRDAFQRPPRETPFPFEPRGPEVPPGEYRITITYKNHKAEGTVQVVADPRFHILPSERRANWEATLRAGRIQETAAKAVKRLLETRADIEVVIKKATQAGQDLQQGEKTGGDQENPFKNLIDAGRDLISSVEAMEKRLRTPPGDKGIGPQKDALSRISYALSNLTSSWDPPTPAQERYLEEATSTLQEILVDFNELFHKEVAAFRRQAQEAGFVLFPESQPLTIDPDGA
ncbi:MAG: hypothetical protein ACE5HD_09070 [Acidobacteriota bacterium]